ncbi:MAG: hypothetical protein ACR2M3_01670 [Thermomicrobiales bacterium]
MSASVVWARSILVPIPGASSAGTVVHVVGRPAQAGWQMMPLFRVLESAQPTLLDFWCYAKLGRVLANIPSAAVVKSYGGLSLYTSLAGARSAARKYNLGTHVAEIIVPLNGWFEMSSPGRIGHVTVMGDGEHLSRFLQQIHAV